MADAGTADGILDEYYDGMENAELPRNEREIEELLNGDVEGISDRMPRRSEEPTASSSTAQLAALYRSATDVIMDEEIREIQQFKMNGTPQNEDDDCMEVIENIEPNGRKGRRISAIAAVEPNPNPTGPKSDPPPKRRKTAAFMIERDTSREVLRNLLCSTTHGDLLANSPAFAAIVASIHRKRKDFDRKYYEIKQMIEAVSKAVIQAKEESVQLTRKNFLLLKTIKDMNDDLNRLKKIIANYSNNPVPQPSAPLPPEFLQFQPMMHQPMHQPIPQTNGFSHIQPAPRFHNMPNGQKPAASFVTKREPQTPMKAPVNVPRERVMVKPVSPPRRVDNSSVNTPPTAHVAAPIAAQPRRSMNNEPVAQQRVSMPNENVNMPVTPRVGGQIIGRDSGHTLESQPIGRLNLIDKTTKKGLHLFVPKIEEKFLKLNAVRAMLHPPTWPRELMNNRMVTCHLSHGSSPPSVVVELKSTKSDFHETWQIAGIVRYNMANLEKKKLQLFVQILSMKPNGLAGRVMMTNDLVEWGTSEKWGCDQAGRTKFRIVLHRMQDFPENDKMSIFALVYDEATHRMDASPVVGLEFV